VTIAKRKKALVIGGGISGTLAALWLRRLGFEGSIVLKEREGHLLQWFRQTRVSRVLVANREVDEAIARLQLAGEGTYPARALAVFPGSATAAWLEEQGLPLETGPEGEVWISRPLEAAQSLEGALAQAQVEVQTQYRVEAIRKQADKRFRVWPKEGEPDWGDCLILATGGERNHMMAHCEEWGLKVDPVEPAFLRLKPASQRLTQSLGDVSRSVTLRCLKSGASSRGQLLVGARGWEGPVLNGFAPEVVHQWRENRYHFSLQIDWLPDLSAGDLRRDLVRRGEQGGRQLMIDSPLWEVQGGLWRHALRLARIGDDWTWSRLRERNRQSFIHALKTDRVAIKGMGLPADERAFSGGIDPAELDPGSGQCLRLPGLWPVGEILNLPVGPSGRGSNYMWASAQVAAQAIAEMQG
jgi:predicted Rossmann fold flavoprotein